MNGGNYVTWEAEARPSAAAPKTIVRYFPILAVGIDAYPSLL
jgi:hypothetical protein